MKPKDWLIMLAAFIVIAGAALYAVKPPGANTALQAADEKLQNTIAVNGEATVTVKPDTVVISIGVTTQAPTAQAAMAQNSTKMNAIVSAMSAAGIKNDDMKTVRFHVGPVYDYKGGSAPRLVGFNASNSLQITMPATANVGQIIDKAAGAGANQIDNISFQVRDVQKYRDEALVKAMADAKQRAEVLAKSAGVSIKGVRSVIESGSIAPIRGNEMLDLRMAKQAADTVVMSGEMILRFNVQVQYTF